jgi:RNA polymerase sigma-70 factor, ECF subfamily
MTKQPLHTLLGEDATEHEWRKRNTASPCNDTVSVEHLPSLCSIDNEEQSLDQLLWLCLQSNQDTLWTEFVRRSQPVIASMVIKTMRRWIKPRPSLIDDLVQETYLKLCVNDFGALRQFVCRHDNALFGFLKVVASNIVQDYFRGVYSRKRGSGAMDTQLESIHVAAAINEPFIITEREILMQSIDRCLKTYENSSGYSRDRAIFWLYYKEGLTAKAISELPSIRLSVKGVESTLWRLVRFTRAEFSTPKSRHKSNK